MEALVKNSKLILLSWVLALSVSTLARAESQGSEYKGITDPFGDPANYEFAEDEKEDKEFFHLGRYLMLGVDIGLGIYTGGLGKTVAPGPYFGVRLQYFFDKSICLEVAGHYVQQEDIVTESSSRSITFATDLLPITLGFRYYFDTKNAPKAISVANPYLAFGGGAYIRNQSVIEATGGLSAEDANTSNFGGYAGGGVEFSIYRRHIYLGADFRYHLIFFVDESDDIGIPGTDRSGDYFTGVLSITYNF